METLVIHVQDPTTTFLKKIYEGKGWDVIDEDLFEAHALMSIIERYDRIIMCGHGSPDGLFGDYGMIIDESFAPLLRTKETVCIWCNADQYVEAHGLTGFYTGMFISEVQEAVWMGVKTSTEESVKRSNELFVEIFSKFIFTDNVLANTKLRYNVDNDDVVAYNNRRLYFE